MFWELRGSGENWEALNLNWSPLIKTSAVSPDGTHDYGCTRINLRLNAASNKRDSTSDLTTAAAAPDKGSLSTKFYGGCDDGEVIYADWYSERTDGTLLTLLNLI